MGLFPTKEDIAWAAGLFDGEGCVFIAVDRSGAQPHHTIRIQVKMVHKETVVRLCSLFGIGRVFCVDSGGKNWSKSWSWIASGKCVIQFIETIYPYSFTKKDELAVALRFAQLPRCSGKMRLTESMLEEREALRQELRNMKSSHKVRRAKAFP